MSIAHKTYKTGTKPVSTIIEEIRSTSSTTLKSSILEREAKIGNEELEYVLHVANDPSIRFFTTIIPEYKTTHEIYNVISATELLVEHISSRKLTGTAALEYISFVLSKTAKEDVDLVCKIIKKDLDCGIGATTINKYFKNCVFDPPYQQYSLFSEKYIDKIKLPYVSQFKADGTYGNNIVTKDSFEIVSRQGIAFGYKLQDKFIKHLQYYAEHTTEFVLHGEALVKKRNADGSWTGEFLPRKEGNGLLNSDTPPKPEDIFLEVWDVVTLEEYNNRKSNRPYFYNPKGLSRYDILRDLVESEIEDLSDCIRIVETRICNTTEDIIQHFKEIRDKGLEGSMLKPIDMLWEDKKSTKAFKLKAIFECEYKVIGYTEHDKKKDWIGALICESECGKVKFKCGSGLKHSDIKKPFSFYEGKIITVKANDLTTSKTKATYSLSHPRFIEVRNDKTVADSFEKVLESRDSMVDLLKKVK